MYWSYGGLILSLPLHFFAKGTYELCEENSFFYNVYTEDEVIASSLNYNILFYHKENVFF